MNTKRLLEYRAVSVSHQLNILREKTMKIEINMNKEDKICISNYIILFMH